MLDVRASSETIMREPGNVSKIISITMQYWNLNIPWQKDRSLQVDFPIAKKIYLQTYDMVVMYTRTQWHGLWRYPTEFLTTCCSIWSNSFIKRVHILFVSCTCITTHIHMCTQSCQSIPIVKHLTVLSKNRWLCWVSLSFCSQLVSKIHLTNTNTNTNTSYQKGQRRTWASFSTTLFVVSEKCVTKTNVYVDVKVNHHDPVAA